MSISLLPLYSFILTSAHFFSTKMNGNRPLNMTDTFSNMMRLVEHHFQSISDVNRACFSFCFSIHGIHVPMTQICRFNLGKRGRVAFCLSVYVIIWNWTCSLNSRWCGCAQRKQSKRKIFEICYNKVRWRVGEYWVETISARYRALLNIRSTPKAYFCSFCTLIAYVKV